jgi:hypothetical protein
VADSNNNAVKEIPVGNGTPITLGSGFNFPIGLAVDGAGNVYVADSGNSALKEIPAGNGTPITLVSGVPGSSLLCGTFVPVGVAVDQTSITFLRAKAHASESVMRKQFWPGWHRGGWSRQRLRYRRRRQRRSLRDPRRRRLYDQQAGLRGIRHPEWYRSRARAAIVGATNSTLALTILSN